MRNFPLAAAFLALTLAAAGPALAESAAAITVTGEGKVSLAPDMATINLGVVTEGATAAEAMAANSTALAEVMASLAAAGIAPRDVQTSGLSLNPRYEESPARNGEAAVTGFVARNVLTVRVRALDGLGSVVDAAVKSGANNLYGLGFGLAEPEAQMDEARRAAVADARRKAALYAEAAGVKLGPVISISEQGGFAQPMMRGAGVSFAADAGVPVAEGELDVSASVTVVYGLTE